jgi:asparagine synthetase B (glutamine-hydrolysing)
MCGIVYNNSFLNEDVSAWTIEMFNKQIDRGVKGFGFYLPQTDKLVHNTRQGRILSLLRREYPSEVMFHHRNPSRTSNRRDQCHPFSTKNFFDANYVMVHNGRIDNEYTRRTAHKELGIEYVSHHHNGRFEDHNDSESLLWDLALYMEGKVESVESAGAIAFVMVKMVNGKPDTLYFGRNKGRPLGLDLRQTGISIASEHVGKLLPTDTLYSYHYATRKLTTAPLELKERPVYQSHSFLPRRHVSSTPDSFKGWAYAHDGARRYFTGPGQEVGRKEYLGAVRKALRSELPNDLFSACVELDDKDKELSAALEAATDWTRPGLEDYLYVVRLLAVELEAQLETQYV